MRQHSASRNPCCLWLLFVLPALLAGCAGAEGTSEDAAFDSFTPRPVTGAPGARRFRVVAEPGEVPGVAEQPTARGHSIATLAPFGSHMFLGYGDYSENTGPIAAISYDVESRSFDAGAALETEELLDFQVHAGQLFAAELDPRGDKTLGSVERLDARGTWRALPDIPDAVHTFGMTEFQGQLFVGTGSTEGSTARVVRTSDSGETWSDSHTTPTSPDTFARYTHLGASSSELFVSGRVHGEPSVPFAYAWNGERWDSVSGLPSDGFLIPLVLDDDLFVLLFSGDRGKGGRDLGSYHLEARALVAREPLLVDETFVNWNQETATDSTPARTWVLTEGVDRVQSVYLATSATSWQLVSELPSLPNADLFTSIAYLDDTIYLGTASGGLCAVEEIFELADGA